MSDLLLLTPASRIQAFKVKLTAAQLLARALEGEGINGSIHPVLAIFFSAQGPEYLGFFPFRWELLSDPLDQCFTANAVLSGDMGCSGFGEITLDHFMRIEAGGDLP